MMAYVTKAERMELLLSRLNRFTPTVAVTGEETEIELKEAIHHLAQSYMSGRIGVERAAVSEDTDPQQLGEPERDLDHPSEPGDG